MKQNSLQVQNGSSWKLFMGVLVILVYWLYINISIGYHLTLFIRDFIDIFLKDNKTWRIPSFKNFIKFIDRIFYEWCLRVAEKFKALKKASEFVWRTLKAFLNQFKPIRNLKRILALKQYKLLLEALLCYIAVVSSFLNELLSGIRLVLWCWEWILLLRFIMAGSLIITLVVWFFLTSLFGMLSGVLLALYNLYKKKKNRDLSPYFSLFFLLLLLIKLLYGNELEQILLHYLQYLNWVLRPSDVRENLLSFKTLEINNTRLFKVTFEDKHLIQVPEEIPIIIDPFIWIGDDLEFDTPDKYKFELFEFYKNSKLKKLKL